jgi:hypothetical protein
MLALAKLLHFIFLAKTLDDLWEISEDITLEKLIENSKVVWDNRPMWDDTYEF